MGVLAGAGNVFGAGMLDTGVAFDPAILVMDNEWAEMLMQVSRGIVVNDETLMVDEIHKVGPHGDFLSLDSTLKHMREQSQPRADGTPRPRGLGGRRRHRPLHALSRQGARAAEDPRGRRRSTPTCRPRCVPS